MNRKKPYAVIDERLKNNHIEINIFKRRNIFSFRLLMSIGISGTGIPDHGEYQSFFEAKNAALHLAASRYQSPPESAIVGKFRIMKDLDQPLLFYT